MFAAKLQVVVALLDKPFTDVALLVLGHTSLIFGVILCFHYEVHLLYIYWLEPLRRREFFDDWCSLGLFLTFLNFLSRLTSPFPRHHSACILLTSDPESFFPVLNDLAALLSEERRGLLQLFQLGRLLDRWVGDWFGCIATALDVRAQRPRCCIIEFLEVELLACYDRMLSLPILVQDARLVAILADVLGVFESLLPQKLSLKALDDLLSSLNFFLLEIQSTLHRLHVQLFGLLCRSHCKELVRFALLNDHQSLRLAVQSGGQSGRCKGSPCLGHAMGSTHRARAIGQVSSGSSLRLCERALCVVKGLASDFSKTASVSWHRLVECESVPKQLGVGLLAVSD